MPESGGVGIGWNQQLQSGRVASKTELGRQLGAARPHVTQVLSLLLLALTAQASILRLGDLIEGKGLGVGTLRSLLSLPVERQVGWVGLEQLKLGRLNDRFVST